MRCAAQPSGTRQTIGLDRVPRVVAAFAMAFAIVVMMSATSQVFAQSPTPTPTPTPTPSLTPILTPTSTNYDQSHQGTVGFEYRW